jgi:epoxyqueuosine reductase
LPPQTLTQQLHDRALELGFDQFGVAPAVTPGGFQRLLQWLADGYAGTMHWISRRRDAYESPAGIMPGTRSLIVVALNYNTDSVHQSGGRVSRYAWSDADYHAVIRTRLRALGETLHTARPGARSRVVVDTAPLLERDFARLAGIGWFGKNTMLISRAIGSWFFIGVILTDVELDYDAPYEDTWCGTCTRCLDECPIDAFPEPGVLDATKCISYLTIELRQEQIPPEFRRGVGDWVFGCDICQDVCPWNRFAPHDTIRELQPRSDLNPVDCRRLLSMSPAQFASALGSTPLARPGYSGIRRNAAIVLGNQRAIVAEPELTTACRDADPLVRGAAAWALGRLQTATAARTLQTLLREEQDSAVRTEIQRALDELDARESV